LKTESELERPMLDVVIVGGGFSGTIAAIVLARAGYQIGLVDRHAVYPADFRAEHLDEVQTDALRRLQLLDDIVAGVPCIKHVAFARRGRLDGIWPAINYGMRYDAMVNAARTLVPPSVEILVGRVADLQAGPVHQRVMVADGRILTCRLLVVATGLGYALCGKLGITRRVLHERHSLTFGFDLEPQAGGRFSFPFLVYQGERFSERIDYLAAFPLGASTRANLFTYRDHRDPWTQALQREPAKALSEAMPGLAKVLGPFHVSGPVQPRAMDLYSAEGFRRAGVVLIGDAFQTACPAAGQGIIRALTDVERLCRVHVPHWLTTPGMAAEKINAFYDDPLKQACDTQAMHTAHYRRALTTETSLGWGLHRRRLQVQGLVRGLAQRVPIWLQGELA
jgi:2-polyprenyl-6-methoxyphenol hydroxylase-like FAD-dependent oxidoreductase